jgi:hypothetical protein
MEREDEDPSQAHEDAAPDEAHGQRRLAESNRSDGEALALHEI